jgi:hypothetical protein
MPNELMLIRTALLSGNGVAAVGTVNRPNGTAVSGIRICRNDLATNELTLWIRIFELDVRRNDTMLKRQHSLDQAR